MRVPITAIIFAVSTLALAVEAPTPEELRLLQHDYYLMEKLRLTYSDEIFDYCVKQHGSVAAAAAGCMSKQDKFKTSILEEAQDQLGTHSLAQEVYDDCLDYYPRHSVQRIRECVRTRLALTSRLQDDDVEKTIYRRCDVKWRDHGFRSVDNCCSAQARYFLQNGKLRE